MRLKPIGREGLPRALQKAERYRLLNQPWAAESICLDILEVEPAHQEALVMLILAITDQLRQSLGPGVTRARELLPRLTSDYQREYYAGIIAERRALAELEEGAHGAGHNAHSWLSEAMAAYERAERLKPAGNDDATLRWNTCARLIRARSELKPRPEPGYEPALED